MYSYEERLRAVKLYIKFGKRVQATVRELGYPMKTTLVAGQPKACRALERFEGTAHEAIA